MKKILYLSIITLLLFTLCTYHTANKENPSMQNQNTIEAKNELGIVEVSFPYERQEITGSNQFVVWIEDEKGNHIKTLYVTEFTAKKGGWSFRKSSLPKWVGTSGIANMNDDQIDSISQATPPSGDMLYTWDCTDDNGNLVIPEKYIVHVEGSFEMHGTVVYKAQIDIGGEPQEFQPEPEYFGNATEKQSMIGPVIISYKK